MKLSVLLAAPLALVGAAAPAWAESASGLRLDQIDRSVAPGEDFFLFANGKWFRAEQFGADQTYIGARSALIARRRERIRAIVEDASRESANGNRVARIVGPFYKSFLDTAAISAKGLGALRPEMRRIRAVRSRSQLLDLFAEAPAKGLPSPLAGSVFYDFHAPGRLRYRLEPAGFGLPLRELYLDDDARSRGLRADYRAYLADLLRLAGEAHPDRAADAVLALETELARASWPTADARNFLKTANSLSVSELKALSPRIDWSRFLDRAGVAGVDTIIVAQPSAMAPLTDVILKEPLGTWRSWALVHLISMNAPYLSDEVASRRFAFFGQKLAGQSENSPRWQRGIDLVEGYFGHALGQLYVERHFPERNKQIITEMFANIRAEMRARIVNAVWMTESTRHEALKKIDTINVKIGYPGRWPDYPELAFDPRDFYANLRKARAYAWAERVMLVRAPLAPDQWMTTAQTSGAAANPNLNEITIPAGALEPPYFDPDADAAVNYGAIGGIIGHELSHLFDQLGRQMDATGKLRDWWAPEDAARYEAIAAKVVAQYDGIELAPGLRVNGRITQNENIADIAGLSVAHAAWKRSLKGNPAPVLDGFTGDQRFFLAWAQMRAGKMTEATLRQQLASGPHAPDEVRANQPMRNTDAWYSAFDVKPGQRLYLAPEARAHFW